MNKKTMREKEQLTRRRRARHAELELQTRTPKFKTISNEKHRENTKQARFEFRNQVFPGFVSDFEIRISDLLSLFMDSLTVWVELVLSRNPTEDFVLRWITDDSHRILAALHRLDRLLEHLPEQDNSFVRYAEMLLSTVENRALTLLRAAILIAASNPTGLLIPAILAVHAVEQSFIGLVSR
jgi:hypothetical protein